MKTRPKPSKATLDSRRNGTLVICVLACLLVVSSILMATTHSALRHRRSLQLEHQLRQTELLLDAGVLRAASRLSASADYQGETWQLKESTLGFAQSQVDIIVSDGSESDTKLVTVTARLGNRPLDDGQGSTTTNTAGWTQRSHRFQVNFSADNESPNNRLPDPSSVE